ncbi:MAG TPA: DUF5615 family PIN-like protein [Stellaceae bacterium]|nr:DUF5615 family PIN-like protein [Stellaceae bacterium]
MRASRASGAPDTQVLNAASSASRILITEDRDFGELVIRQRVAVYGVILLELDRVSNELEAATVAEIVSSHADKFVGNLVIVEPGRIRVRPLRR